MSEQRDTVLGEVNEEVGLVVNGRISVLGFGAVMTNFGVLLESLSNRGGLPSIEWNIAPVPHRGAAFSATGVGSPDAIQDVLRGFRSVGEAVVGGKLPELGYETKKSVAKLVGLNESGVESISFLAGGDTWMTAPRQFNFPTFDEPDQEDPSKGPRTRPVLDAVRGTIHTISSRNKLEAILWDTVFDTRIPCQLSPGQESLARERWMKQVIVTGFVHRAQDTGIPSRMSEIQDIQELPAQEEGTWRLVLARFAKLFVGKK